jgi:glycosyltransferase involved in cell wall biosynthesis
MKPPRLSIVLPTRNGAATLPPLLDSLARQRVDDRFEIIAVDSSSTDGTSGILRGRVDHLLTIAPEAFDHGATRNAGIARAAGELVVLIVQDALPASDTWLAALTAPFADPGLAGAFARQIPRPEATALTRHYLAGWAGSSETPRTLAVADAAEFARLPPTARLERCTFDNVCSCIRRSVWLAHPFRPTPIAEDLAWARDVLLAGHRLAYAPEAVVIHSHDRPARDEFVRTYRLHRRLCELFELRTIPTAPALSRAVASSLSLHLRCRRHDPRPGTLSRAVALAFAWPLGQYLGARAAGRGPHVPRTPETT